MSKIVCLSKEFLLELLNTHCFANLPEDTNFELLSDEEKDKRVEQLKSKIANLEILLKKANNRNEYNENLYKQQFLSFKDDLVENLKHSLRLEIKGLEEIADSLNEVQKERIQRRIDRIYKKIEEVIE